MLSLKHSALNVVQSFHSFKLISFCFFLILIFWEDGPWKCFNNLKWTFSYEKEQEWNSKQTPALGATKLLNPELRCILKMMDPVSLLWCWLDWGRGPPLIYHNIIKPLKSENNNKMIINWNCVSLSYTQSQNKIKNKTPLIMTLTRENMSCVFPLG